MAIKHTEEHMVKKIDIKYIESEIKKKIELYVSIDQEQYVKYYNKKQKTDALIQYIITVYPPEIKNHPSFNDNIELMKLVVEYDGLLLQYGGRNVRNDAKVCQIAIKNNFKAIKYVCIPEKDYRDIIQDDDELFIAFLRYDFFRCFDYGTTRQQNDITLIKKVLAEINIPYIYIDKSYNVFHNDNIMKLLLSAGLEYKHCTRKQKRKIEFIEIAVMRNGYALADAPKWENNERICTLALQQIPRAIRYIGHRYAKTNQALHEDYSVIYPDCCNNRFICC